MTQDSQATPYPAITTAKAVLFILSLLPLAWLIWLTSSGQLGANPVEKVQTFTGIWTFNFLLLTLLISPLRVISGQNWLLRLRRMLGLFTFFYACLHLLAFTGFDHDFSLNAIAYDITRRPFIAIGFAAFVLMVPLALTSNRLAIRKLGGRKWQDLHRVIYLIALLACLHFLWLSKITEIGQALIYTVLTALLLWWRIQRRKQSARPPPPTTQVQPLHFHRKRPD